METKISLRFLNAKTTRRYVKTQIFWDVMQCHWTSSARRLVASHGLHLQHKQSKKNAWPWRWKRYDPSKRQEPFAHRHGITSQKTRMFINTDVKTWNIATNVQVHPHLLEFQMSSTASPATPTITKLTLLRKEGINMSNRGNEAVDCATWWG